jgi:hypothetical protein
LTQQQQQQQQQPRSYQASEDSSSQAKSYHQSVSNLNLAAYDADSSSSRSSSSSSSSSFYANIDVLRIQHINESRNYTCQAQNLFGLVLFNLSLIIKGKLENKTKKIRWKRNFYFSLFT